MKILKLEWRNMFSYGNKIETIEFGDDSKLWLLSGVSGAGKTSLLTIPKLLLYGKTEGSDGKPFKVGAVANRINKHGWIRGTVQNGQDIFVIERTFSPQGLTIYKNGENIDKAGSKNLQAVIDTEVLDGMPYHIFSNVMTLSLNNFKSFVSMTPADKRAIIDKLFSLEIINKVYELVRKDKRDTGNSINEINASLFQIERNINLSAEQLAAAGSPVDKTPLMERAKTISDVINKLSEVHATQTEMYKDRYAKYTEIHNLEVQINALISKENVEMSHINQQISLFNEDKCPTCGTPFNGSEFDTLRESLSKSLAEHRASAEGYGAQLSELAARKAEINGELSQIQNNLNQLVSKDSELRAELRSIEAEINKPDQYAVVNGIIEKNQEEKRKFEADLEAKQANMNLLGIMETLYSADGIKQQMMNRFIPMLNEDIRKALDALGFPYTLTFDGNFDPHLQHLGEEIEPQTLSCGEHKKVDLTVLCAILTMLKRKYPQVNLVCLDETVSSLDPESSANVLGYLKMVANDMGLNIFVVTHTSIDEGAFDVHLFVDKHSGFSELKYI